MAYVTSRGWGATYYPVTVRYLVTAVISAGAGSGADSGGHAGVGAEVDVGMGARSGSPASGTFPDAAIALGCRSNATSPLQPV
jgi:hypothetical protein